MCVKPRPLTVSTMSTLLCLFIVVISLFGGAHAQDVPSGECFGAGSVAGAAVGAFLAALLLVLIIVILRRFYWRSRKGKHLVLVTDPENVKDEFAFDNAGFKSGEHPATLENGRGGKSGGGLGDAQWLPGETRLSDLHLHGRRTVTQDDSTLEQQRAMSHLVSLWSRDFTGLGLTVSGGSKDGIFIANVLRSGPAAASGLINTGDRINSVRISFRNMVLEDAMTILSYASPYEIQLEVEPSRYSTGSRNHNAIEVVHPVLGIGGTRRRRNSSGDFESLEKASKHRHFSSTTSPNSNTSTLEISNSSKPGGIKKIITEKIITTSSLEKGKPVKEKKLDSLVVERENEKNISKIAAAKILDAALAKPDKNKRISEVQTAHHTDSGYIEKSEIQKTEAEAKRGMKFGIRVLPPNIQDGQKPVVEAVSIDEVDKIERERKLSEPPVVARRREKPVAPTPNARHISKQSDHLETATEIKTTTEYVTTFERHSTNSSVKRDENGIPQEIPQHMMDAALAARSSRKTDIEFDKAELDKMVSDKSLKKSKGKAPSPPARRSELSQISNISNITQESDISLNEMKNTSGSRKLEFSDNFSSYDNQHINHFLDNEKLHSSVLLFNTSTPRIDKLQGKKGRVYEDSMQFTQDDIEDIMGRPFSKKESDSLNNYFEDSKSNRSSNVDGHSVLSLGNTSEADKHSTTVELSTSNVTVHSSARNVDDDDDLENERKAASLGDLSKLEKIKITTAKPSQGTLERAQSLDITADDEPTNEAALAPKKRKSNSVIDTNFYGNSNTDMSSNVSTVMHSKEPRLSLNVAKLSGLEGLNVFQTNRLKKASEFGTLEDAIEKEPKLYDSPLMEYDENLKSSEKHETHISTRHYTVQTSTENIINTRSPPISPNVDNVRSQTVKQLFTSVGKVDSPPLKSTNEFIPVNELTKVSYDEKVSIGYDTNLPDDLKVSRHTLVSSLEKPKSDMMRKLLAQNPVLQNVHLEKQTVQSDMIFGTSRVTNDTPHFKFSSQTGAATEPGIRPVTIKAVDDGEIIRFIGEPPVDKPKAVEKASITAETFDTSKATVDSPLLKFITRPDAATQNTQEHVIVNEFRTESIVTKPERLEEKVKEKVKTDQLKKFIDSNVNKSVQQIERTVDDISPTRVHVERKIRYESSPLSSEQIDQTRSETITTTTTQVKRLSTDANNAGTNAQDVTYKRMLVDKEPKIVSESQSANFAIQPDKARQTTRETVTTTTTVKTTDEGNADNIKGTKYIIRDIESPTPGIQYNTTNVLKSTNFNIKPDNVEQKSGGSVIRTTTTTTQVKTSAVDPVDANKSIKAVKYPVRESTSPIEDTDDHKTLHETHTIRNYSVQPKRDDLNTRETVTTTTQVKKIILNANKSGDDHQDIQFAIREMESPQSNMERRIASEYHSSNVAVQPERAKENVTAVKRIAVDARSSVNSTQDVVEELMERNKPTFEFDSSNITMGSNQTTASEQSQKIYSRGGATFPKISEYISNINISGDKSFQKADDQRPTVFDSKLSFGDKKQDSLDLVTSTQGKNVVTISSEQSRSSRGFEQSQRIPSIVSETLSKSVETRTAESGSRNIPDILTKAVVTRHDKIEDIENVSGDMQVRQTNYNMKEKMPYNVDLSSEELPTHKTVTVNVTEDEHGNRIVTRNVEQINTKLVTVRTQAPVEVEQITYGIIRNPTERDRLSIEDSENVAILDERLLAQIQAQNPGLQFRSDSPSYSKTETVLLNKNLNEEDALALMNKLKSQQSLETVIGGRVRRDASTDRIEMTQRTYKINTGTDDHEPMQIIKTIGNTYGEGRVQTDSDSYITEIQVLTPNTERLAKSNEYRSNISSPESFSLTFEVDKSLLYDFLLNERMHSEREKLSPSRTNGAVIKVKKSNDEHLPRNSHIKFRTATYETRHESPEKTRSQIEILRSNFERGESPSPTGSLRPSTTARPSGIPVKQPDKSRDGQRSNSTSPSKIPLLFGAPATHVQENFTKKMQTTVPTATGNITITSIKSSSRNPSGK